jgi:hypothetical protein
VKPPDRSEETQLKSEVEEEKARHVEVKARALRAIDAIRVNQGALVQAYEQAEKRRK